MASFGAKFPCFSKIVSEPTGALPVYDTPVVIGRLIKAELTVTNASGQLFADDALAESVDEFSSGSIEMETDDMLDDVAAEVYGCTVEGKCVHYKRGDSAPKGGLAYYKALMRRGVKLYKGYFYPYVKAVLGNDNAETKSDKISFGTTATTFTVFGAESDDWRITEEFQTEAEAKAWVLTQLGGGSAATPTASPEAGAVASGTSVKLSCTTEGAAIHYTLDGSEPTEASDTFTEDIQITEAVTIKAKAFADGHIPSDTLSAEYTVSP